MSFGTSRCSALFIQATSRILTLLALPSRGSHLLHRARRLGTLRLDHVDRRHRVVSVDRPLRAAAARFTTTLVASVSHYFIPFLDLPADRMAIAIACFCGLPAFISVLILDEMTF